MDRTADCHVSTDTAADVALAGFTVRADRPSGGYQGSPFHGHTKGMRTTNRK